MPYAILRSNKYIKEGPKEKVYRWEQWLLNLLAFEPPMEKAPAYAFVARVWAVHSGRFSPYFTDTPFVDFESEPRPGHACFSWETHTLICHKADTRRSVLLHELAHGMTWNDGHGCDFCGTLVNLWEAVFSLDRAAALKSAKLHGVAVNDSVPWRPSLPTEFPSDAWRKLMAPRRR